MFGVTSNCGQIHILHRHIHIPNRTPFYGRNLLFASIANTYDTFNQNLVWLSIADEFAKSFCSALVGQFAHNQAYNFLCVVTITTDKWLIFFAVFLHYVHPISRDFPLLTIIRAKTYPFWFFLWLVIWRLKEDFTLNRIELKNIAMLKQCWSNAVRVLISSGISESEIHRLLMPNFLFQSTNTTMHRVPYSLVYDLFKCHIRYDVFSSVGNSTVDLNVFVCWIFNNIIMCFFWFSQNSWRTEYTQWTHVMPRLWLYFFW